MMDRFQHEPLNHTKSSLRLLSVLHELSPNGLVQCVLYHGVIDEVQGAILPSQRRVDYTCLSYVWGTAETSSQYCLVINGKNVEVLRNLHDFLHIAHQQYVGEFLWIDALCIDQDNLEERNHQVSEMGSIYSRAKQVIAWLGACEVNLNALRMLQIKTQNPLPGLTPYQDDYMISEFFIAVDSYWSRAWITQEVALARRVLLLFGTAELDLSTLDKRQISVVVNQMDRWTRRNEEYSSSSLLRIWTLAKSQQSRVKKPEDCVANVSLDSDSISLQTGSDDACLLTLLSQFRNKECIKPRDRIYSLRSLCEEGPRLEIDYSMSSINVLHHIIRISQRSLCFCSAMALIRALSSESRPCSEVSDSVHLDFRFSLLDEDKIALCSGAGLELDRYNAGIRFIADYRSNAWWSGPMIPGTSTVRRISNMSGDTIYLARLSVNYLLRVMPFIDKISDICDRRLVRIVDVHQDVVVNLATGLPIPREDSTATAKVFEDLGRPSLTHNV